MWCSCVAKRLKVALYSDWEQGHRRLFSPFSTDAHSLDDLFWSHGWISCHLIWMTLKFRFSTWTYFSTSRLVCTHIFFKVNFYWSVVALQCGVSFCCAAKWISHADTYICSILDFLPIQVAVEHWVEFPVLFVNLFYAPYQWWSTVCVCVYRISQFLPLPPLLSPLVSMYLLSTPVSLFLLGK